MHLPAGRAFQRREDYLPASNFGAASQPPQTPSDSPFRWPARDSSEFDVKCLQCGSYRLRLVTEFDDEAGELSVVLFCPSCRQREVMPLR